MKKISLLLMTCLIVQNIGFAVTDSANCFPTNFVSSEIPGSQPPKKDDSGLSGGAVTAITLGSIGAVALGGLGYFIYNKFLAKGLACGCAAGLDCPIMSLCLDNNAVCGMIKKYPENTLLNKIFEKICINECCKSKYVIIQDTSIRVKTFNTATFEIPEGYSNFRVVSANTNDNVKFDIYSDVNKEDKIKLKTIEKFSSENIIIKEGKVPCSKTGMLVTTLNGSKCSECESYAFVIEFY